MTFGCPTLQCFFPINLMPFGNGWARPGKSARLFGAPSMRRTDDESGCRRSLDQSMVLSRAWTSFLTRLPTRCLAR